jgi:hypothetical protein
LIHSQSNKLTSLLELDGEGDDYHHFPYFETDIASMDGSRANYLLASMTGWLILNNREVFEGIISPTAAAAAENTY